MTKLADHEIISSPDIGIEHLNTAETVQDAKPAMSRAIWIGNEQHNLRYNLKRGKNSLNLQIEADLYRAIEREEFKLYYQPIFTNNGRSLSGVESLIRWQHPIHGLLLPDSFIHIAEESGLILQIGDWVLKTACRQAKTWHEKGFSNLKVSVNISACQLFEPDFARMLVQTLTNTRLPPDFLEIEITESVAMQHTDQSLKILRDLIAHGVKVALDDFGKGYSSLSYLKLFPFSTLKIDRFFTRFVTSDPVDAAIVSAIIALAHALEIEVVAEGVETRDQLDFFNRLNCDHVQGFLFSPPVSAESFEMFLKQTIITHPYIH